VFAKGLGFGRKEVPGTRAGSVWVFSVGLAGTYFILFCVYVLSLFCFVCASRYVMCFKCHQAKEAGGVVDYCKRVLVQSVSFGSVFYPILLARIVSVMVIADRY